MCMCLQCCMYVCDVHRALSNNHYLSLTLTMIILTNNRQYGSTVIYRSVIITYNNNWVISSTKGITYKQRSFVIPCPQRIYVVCMSAQTVCVYVLKYYIACGIECA